MTEKYTGQDRRYAGDDVDITYSLKRCIHAEFCVRRLSAVFNKDKRPWIQLGSTTADAVAAVVELCPSGALHYERHDGLREAVPTKNVVTVRRNGPLEIRGDLVIQGAAVDLQHETRVTLCRCGASNNKPFCDNMHRTIGFDALDTSPVDTPAESPVAGQLTITAQANGSLRLDGPLEIVNEAGDVLFTGNQTWLCRCGGSAKKPFCDGTHKRNGFAAE